MKLELDFSANKNCADVFLEVYCDDKAILKSPAQAVKQTVQLELLEHPADHVLRLIMHGKNHTHTVVDQQDQIVDDVYFTVDRLEFEELDMKEIFCQGQNCYTHSFNQDQPTVIDEFYGFIGCNGSIDFKFSTPFFLWLNQHFD